MILTFTTLPCLFVPFPLVRVLLAYQLRASALSWKVQLHAAQGLKSRHCQRTWEAKLLQDQAQKLQEKQQLVDEVQKLKADKVRFIISPGARPSWRLRSERSRK